MRMSFDIEFPAKTTLGDLTMLAGVLFEASTEFADWEKLRNGEANAVSVPGVVLMQLAAVFRKEGKS